MTMSRLSSDIIDATSNFINATASAWMHRHIVELNSYGVELLVSPRPGGNFTDATVHTFGWTNPNSEHGAAWYIDNGHGKNLICLEAGMDSHEAIDTWAGMVRQIEGAFPWPGAIIDLKYGLCIGTSGFEGDEDLMFSRAVRNFIVMHLDREGKAVLKDAENRGKGETNPDRFTRSIVLV